MGATSSRAKRISQNLALVLALISLPAAALAQDSGPSYRAPVTGKPLVWEGQQPRQSTEQQPQQPSQPGGQQVQPTPEQQAQPKSKFPNIDTAKNRRDYDMSTSEVEGKDGITMSRDDASGDNVVRHVPQKKERQKAPGEDMPITVRPNVQMPQGTK